MPDFGGRAIPGISFRVGSSHADLSQVKGDLQGIKDILTQIQDEAKQTTASLNSVGKARPAATKASTDPAYEAAVAQRRTAQRQETVRRANDPLEQEYAQHTATQRRTRMQVAVAPPSDTERQYQEIVARDRQKAMEETIKRGTTKDTSLLARGVNAAGWSPFMPQSTYMAQMMLGEMGLGLSMPLVAAGMGAIGIGAAGLGLNAFATDAQHTGAQLVSATGAPPFSANTFATPADEAKLLLQRTGAQGLNLPGNDGQQAVSALAAGGLSGKDAFGTALDQTAVLVNAFGMSVSDAANFVTTMQVQMRRSTDDTALSIAAFGKVADATGQPLAALGQIAAQTPNMLANLSGQDVAVAASVARAMAGSTQGGIALQSVSMASGAQALSIAAQMGITDQQFNALQGTAGGNKQIDDFVVGVVKQSMAQSGGAIDQAMLVANARLGMNLDKASFSHLNGLGPGFSTTAFNQALNAPTPPVVPGSASNVNALVANGNFFGASNTANPANVKDVTLNAAQVFLTGAVSFGESYPQALQSGAKLTQPQLAQIAQQGGTAGIVARGQSFLQGLVDWAISTGLNIHQQATSVPASPPGTTPGGGGSNGGNLGTVTINLTQNNQRIASIPVAIQNGRPSQQYQQYVRGQQ